MSLSLQKKVAVAGLIVILLLINWKIAAKEQHLSNGRVVLLELAPVDPRSLMQGDYMTLRFALAREIRSNLRSNESKNNTAPADGFVEVMLEDNGIGRFIQVAHDTSAIPEPSEGSKSLWLQYRIRNEQIKFATNAFFFQEGHAKFYESARYGEFRVNDHGELLLTGMRGEGGELLKPAPENPTQ